MWERRAFGVTHLFLEENIFQEMQGSDCLDFKKYLRNISWLSHWSQNKDWIEHDVVFALRCWSPLLWFAFGIPICLPKKLYWLDSLLTIAARLFSLLLSIHNITIIVEKRKKQPQWNLNALNRTFQYGRKLIHFRTVDARPSLYFEISKSGIKTQMPF